MAKKKTKLKIALGSGSILLLIIAVLAVLYLTPLGQTTIGVSTLSIDKVEYFKSSSICFDSSNEPLWVYTVRAGGLGQWADAGSDAGDISDWYDGKETTERRFRIDTKFDQECEYPLITNEYATPIYIFSQPIEWSIGFDLTCKDSEIIERCGSGDYFTGGKYFGFEITRGCWCTKAIKKTGAIGSQSNFNNPDVHSIMEIEVSNGDDKKTRIFDTNGQIKGKIGSNVCAVWQGNLVNGKSSCPRPSSEVLPIYTNGEWELISNDKYETYKSAWDNWFDILKQSNLKRDSIIEAINGLNNKANSAVSSRINFGTINQPTNLRNAKIIKEMDELTQFPVLSLYVKAEWLGVVTPIPDPKIKSAESDCFGSGRAGKIKLVIKNQGDERGEIDVYGDCTSNFDVSSKSISLGGGESKTVYLEITGTTDQEEIKGVCTIYADALENIDQKEVSVCVQGHSQCTKGEEWCEGKNAWHCPDPINPEIKDNCLDKELVCAYTQDGKAICRADENWCDTHPDDPECGGSGCGNWFTAPKWLGGWGFPDLFCLINAWVFKFRLTLAIIVGLLSALVSGNLWRTAENRFNFATRKKQWVAILVGAVIGIAIGFVLYVYFFLGLGVLIALLIIKIAMKRFGL